MNEEKLFFKKNGGLYPANEIASSFLKKIAEQEILSVKIKKTRNPKFNSKFWNLLKIVEENTSINKRKIYDMLRYELGYWEMKIMQDGFPVIEFQSISFENMDEIEFSEFFENCLDFIIQNEILDVSKKQIQEQLKNYI